MSVEDEVLGEEEAEDTEELFYESLDRILSSSASSTSASDDDGGGDHPRRRRGYDDAALDLWTSQPAPIQERRHRLLQLMGLAGDPSLARFQMGRSASYDDVGDSPVSRPRSDGASTAKPPIGGGRLRSTSSDASDASATLEAVEEDPSCLIRNLDDGSEFVVREEFGLREVGTGRQLTVEEFELFIGRSPIVQELMRRQSVTHSNPNSNSQSGASTPMERSSPAPAMAGRVLGGAAAGSAPSAVRLAPWSPIHVTAAATTKTRPQRRVAATPARLRKTARMVLHAMAQTVSRCATMGSHTRSSVACS
ncbi:hypothetical protein ZWY2020_021218 [Hordeum vulgare]|nr:hypothetical protein ZWY2020_021218 [Hordeum vulgare]